jgi:hypothetical protein
MVEVDAFAPPNELSLAPTARLASAHAQNSLQALRSVSPQVDMWLSFGTLFHCQIAA